MNNFIRSNRNACYRRNAQIQLWTLIANNSITIQAQVHAEGSSPKIYEKIMREEIDDTKNSKFKELLTVISTDNSLVVSPSKQGIQLGFSNNANRFSSYELKGFSVELKEKRKGSRIDSTVMLSLMDEKIEGLSARSARIQRCLEWEEPEPIYHQTSKYKFEASLNTKQNHIKTHLFLEDPKSGKKKEYLNTINQSYREQDIVGIFEKMQILFEHLRNPHNYQINYEKGRITIVNQPDRAALEQLSEKVEKTRRLKKPKQEGLPQPISPNPLKHDFDILRKQNKKLEQQVTVLKAQFLKDLEKKFVSQQSKMFQHFRKELIELQDQVSEKLLDFSKGIKPQKIKVIEKKVDIQILEEWKETLNKDMMVKMAKEDRKVKSQLMSLLSEAKRELAIIIHKLRCEFDSMIKENEEKCMNSIDDLEIDLTRRMEDVYSMSSTTKQLTDLNLQHELSVTSQKAILSPRQLDWNPIQIDPSSSQYRRFTFQFDNLVIYNGGWEWTQLFTKTIIPHGSVITLKFKIIRSNYKAIAIGVSDRENIGEKTSLSLKNSIAYWGDRQVWEGTKIKEEGNGFCPGEVVAMTVDTIRGIISWQVGGELRAKHSSPILRDRSLHMMGYIEMYDKGDRIQLLSYKLIQ